MAGSIPKPPYDPELGAALAQLPLPTIVTRESIAALRLQLNAISTVELAIGNRPISHEVRTIRGDDRDIIISIFRRTTPLSSTTDTKPGIYWIHGGGMVSGNRFLGMPRVAEWVEDLDAVCIAIEYRQAPEHPHPAPINDCYAGLTWIGENLDVLQIDPDRLMIAGQSAGGGLAAALALLVRDRGGPKICAQCLVGPMLDDRNTSVSSNQYVSEGSWSRQSNLMGWGCLLGENKVGTEDVSIYAAPGRATDLSGLPTAFIDAGSAEVFRDEAISYASLLWKSGVQVELHIWPGAFHGSDGLIPQATLSKAARIVRSAWVRRTLAAKPSKL